MKRRFCLPCLVPILGCLLASQAFADMSQGARQATACSACHGPGGHSNGSIPSLAGMAPDQFIQRMAEFRRGQGTIMNRVVPAYDSAEIAALARYFATRRARPSGNSR